MIKMVKNGALPFLLGIFPFIGIFLGEKYVPFLYVFFALALIFEKNKKVNLYSNKKVLFPFLIAIGVFITFTFLSPDFKLALKILERQISLLVIPFIIVVSKWNSFRVKFFIKIFISTTFLIGLYSIIKFTSFVINNYDWVKHMAAEKGSMLLYLQYKFPHVIGVHPTYWSYVIISALIFLLSNKMLKVYKSKVWAIFLISFLNINLIILASRMPLLVNFLVLLLFLGKYIKVDNVSLVKRLCLLFLLITLFFVGSKLPLLSGKLDITKNDERIYHWPTAFKTIADNYFVLGEGLGQSNEVLRREVIKNGDERIRYFGYDLHNQYLRQYMDMGILGIISLLILLFYPIFLNRQKSIFNNEINISFLILFGLGLLSESFLYRLKGIVFFTVISSFLYLRAINLNKVDDQ
jgi:O-antigen ligase